MHCERPIKKGFHMDTGLVRELKLSHADTFHTENPEDALGVQSGSVYVYIVSRTEGHTGRKLLLCTLPEGSVFPSFSFVDENGNFWSFAVTPEERAVLSVRKNSVTAELQQEFLIRCGIATYEIEGFEGSLIEFYSQELLRDNISMMRGQRAKPEAESAAYDVIQHAFREEQHHEPSGTLAYNALAFLCEKSGIRILTYDRIEAECGKHASVQEIAHVSGFLCRPVILEADWYRMDIGPVLGVIDMVPVACFRGKNGKYQLYDAGKRTTVPLTPDIARTIYPTAFSVGRALPEHALTYRDTVQFCLHSISVREIFGLCGLMLLCALLGVLLPVLNQVVYDEYIPLGNRNVLTQLCLLIASVMLGNLFITITKNLTGFRIRSRVCYDLQNAAYHRIFRLPETFLRKYDSGDLSERLMSLSGIAGKFVDLAVISFLTLLFSLTYLFRMIGYSGRLTGIAVLLYLAFTAVILLLNAGAIRSEKQIAECDGEASARLVQYLNAIDKLRLAGVEDHAIYSYLKPFASGQSAEIRRNRFLSVVSILSALSSSIFSMIFYLVIVSGQLELSVGAFLGFTSAFGIFTGVFRELLLDVLELYRERERIRRAAPIFTTATEDSGGEELPGKLTGDVRADHVTFSYGDAGRNVLTDISFSIRPGEYVGIVGSSGCGKSTLLKLLLGFETPVSGTITYDGRDLKKLDKSAFRKQLGVVLQDGRLIAGSIYENIVLTSPGASMQEVEAVVDAVGLRDDLQQMPMGLHTVLSETSGTISGGQMQRILIARAIISHPAFLIFDEATSALDNLTQATVSRNLDQMRITRIVVAHRLSTIRNCDRILVLDGGRIAEEGNYDTLMEKRGLFWQLANRQLAE